MTTTEHGGLRGFDAGERIKSRKRHIVSHSLGLMVGAVVHPAGVHDLDGALAVLLSIRKSWPWALSFNADRGRAYDGRARRWRIAERMARTIGPVTGTSASWKVMA